MIPGPDGDRVVLRRKPRASGDDPHGPVGLPHIPE